MTVHLGASTSVGAIEDLRAEVEAAPAIRCLRVADIREAVCAHFGVTLRDILSARRARAIARPRQVAMFLARRLTTRSLPEIARQFGDRDHTTVMHACSTIERLKAQDPDIANSIVVLLDKLEQRMEKPVGLV